MRIIIEIDVGVYARLLEALDNAGGEFRVLKRFFTNLGGHKSASGEVTLTVVGDFDKAKELLEFARYSCPDAVLPIATAINLASMKI